MILVDANVLLYATNSESDQHGKCRGWLDEKLGGAPVGLPWARASVFADRNESARVPPTAEHG